MTRAAPSARLSELDALRGIAAVLVLLFHFTWQVRNVVPEVQPIPLGLSWGSYGVELFFAISGFVIFMTLERTRSTADFLVSRFARLFPAYWAGLAITVAVLTWLGPASLLQPPEVIAANLTMLQGFLYLPAVDGVYWSLTIELAFYFCMWALWRTRHLGRIEAILLGWILLKVVWWMVPALPSRIELLLALDYIPYFAVGIAAYRVRSGARSWDEQLKLLAAGFLAIAMCDGAAKAGVYLADVAVFWLLVQAKLGWLRQPLLLWLGALSYPIYLVHQFTGYAIMRAVQQAGGSVWLALALAIAFAFAAAQTIHMLVETPLLNAIRGWWSNRSARLSPAE